VTFTLNKNLYFSAPEDSQMRYGVNFILTASTFQVLAMSDLEILKAISGPI
jgi:hypothetical protein